MNDTNLLETNHPWDVFDSHCPTRQVLDCIADKWKVLTNTLRSLERDGIVTRRIYASVPPKVEYSLTNLGRSLCGLVEAICGWAEANIERVQEARQVYDQTSREVSISQ